MIRKIPWKTVSKKRGTVLNFRKANNLTKVRETKFPKIPGMKISENLDTPREAVLAFVNSRKCCSIRHRKFLEIQIRNFLLISRQHKSVMKIKIYNKNIN